MVARLLIWTLAWLGVIALLLLIPAGTLAWPAAWLYLGEIGGLSLAVGLWLARHDPGLLAERLGFLVQSGQKGWDKLFMIVIILLWAGWLALMGAEAGRHGPALPVWAGGLGFLAVALALWLSVLTFRANPFAIPVVRIQRERGHRVISDGPYRVVRHPLYAAALLFFLGTPLALGSWLGLILAPVLAAGLAVRAVLEERALAAELDGYAAYAARVRYRLIPGLW